MTEAPRCQEDHDLELSLIGPGRCLTVLSLSLVDCFRFNYRSTHHLTTNGFYEFLNWFDERAWYPLGRIVGGTVSILCLLCVCVFVCVVRVRDA